MGVYIHLSSSHQSPAKTSKEPGAARGSNLSGVWEHGWLKSCHELQTGCQELQTYTSKIIYISMILYVHYNMDIPIGFFLNLTYLNIFDTIQHFHLWLFHLCSTHPAVFGPLGGLPPPSLPKTPPAPAAEVAAPVESPAVPEEPVAAAPLEPATCLQQLKWHAIMGCSTWGCFFWDACGRAADGFRGRLFWSSPPWPQVI